MGNTEMIIANNFAGNNTVNLTNFYSVEAELPTQQTGTTGWNITGSLVFSGIFVNFSRPLNTGLADDKVLFVGLETPFSYAYNFDNTTELVPHINAVQGNIVFGATTGTSSYTPYNPLPPVSFFTLNKYFSLGWSFLADGQTIEFFLYIRII